MKNIKLLFISLIFVNFTYSQQKIIDNNFIHKIYKNLRQCKPTTLSGVFLTDTIKSLESTVLLTVGEVKNHQISYKMKFTSFSANGASEENLNNFSDSEFIIDKIVFKSYDIDFYTDGVLTKLDGIPLDLSNIGGDIDNGKVKYYVEKNGVEYLLIKGGILACNGANCNGYYIILIKIEGNNKDIKIFSYPEVSPFNFDSTNLVKRKNSEQPFLLLYKKVQNKDKINVDINSFSLNKFEYDKNKNGIIYQISYKYNLWKESNIKIVSTNWY